MAYDFRNIEKKWQRNWKQNQTFKVQIDGNKPKYYILDMFPYPSGAGLHVGHPLGYIASDIYARYKRHQGFNVLHPMGYDAFGLPAEQYAIQTGQHPAVTTENNIKRYREQLDKIGFSYDWDREVRTCEPDYYKWTQWAFIQMFKSWFNTQTNKAEPISGLIKLFEQQGNKDVPAACDPTPVFSADAWKKMSETEQQNALLNYRLAYLADTFVNWCPHLGTVLANDEVKEGFSVRGGHPVEQKKMKQWSLRISAYAQRLLDGLEKIDWSDSIKEVQRNWIGKSEGAEVYFPLKGSDQKLLIYTTRPDTIFGVSCMILAPESELVPQLTTAAQKTEVEDYLAFAKKRSERERQAETKKVTGAFTGSYCLHPFTNQPLPIWISDYVLGGYGTGAIMAVPAHDSRDYAFAKHFKLPIVPVVEGGNIEEASHDAKEGKLINSDFLNGLEVKAAIAKAIDEVEKRKIGQRKINYRLRDAIFSRQRYWGEPIPVYYKNGIPYPMNEADLPLKLPKVDAFLPTEAGDPPLGRAENWQTKEGYPLELTTMPGFAGSSAYYLRYMDPQNSKELVSKEAVNYWKSVDFYVGGSEHATGHLIYSRVWNKFLFDLGLVPEDEPFKKLFNQGMIQGRSNFVYRVKNTNKFVSLGLKEKYDVTQIYVDVNIVKNDVLDTNAFKQWRAEYANAEFELENGQYICGFAQEKMSKSLYNVVNPDDMVEQYGADTFRLYEMFLGPVEQSKPWNTSGIEGVHRFLNKLWRLFYNLDEVSLLTDEAATNEELKILHTAIKKVYEDMENFSLNTSVSALMICVNELGKLNCHKRSVLHPLTVLISPFAPHLAEELNEALGNKTSISLASFPIHDDSYLVKTTYSYPISINGKLKFLLELPLDYSKEQIEQAVMAHEKVQSLLEGKSIKKLVIVPNKIVNMVI